MRKVTLVILFCVFAAAGYFSVKKFLQPAPFREEVDLFLKSDKENPPKPNSYLFAGSSSITKWVSLNDSFPGKPIITRGIGGACFPDMLRYADEIIIPYKPNKIFIYCGDNDFSYYPHMTPEKVENNFADLFSLLRKNLPDAEIGYISIKPSPARVNLESNYKEANDRIKAFLSKQPKSFYIDIHTSMINSDGSINDSLFMPDKLHMNEKGYAIWNRAVAPYLQN